MVIHMYLIDICILMSLYLIWNLLMSFYDNWDAITPIFEFSPDVRKVIYTTNAIENLNSTYRKLNRQRRYFQVIQCS